MANVWARDRAGAFYLGMALTGLAAVAIGFSTTYALPMWRRSLSAPPVVHVHGALSLSWVALFIIQTSLVRRSQTRLHRKLGWIGVPLACGLLITGCAVALVAARRDFPAQGPVAASAIVGTVTSLAMFVALVVFAVLRRRRPDWHKRLMLLATIVVLWPAWFRWRHFVPCVERPEIWFALVLAEGWIAVAAARDWLKYGAVHPVWCYFGTGVFVEQSFEVLAFDTGPWRGVGMWIFESFA
jgi:uncharacterized membrane protein YozB (DUF420 family)